MKTILIENLVKDIKHNYLYNNIEYTQEYKEDKISTYYDLLLGQVVFVGSFGRTIPAVVIKVHPKDANLHNRYDIAILVNGNCNRDETSVVIAKERYSWGVIDKVESRLVNKHILKQIKEITIPNFDTNNLCYIEDYIEVIYPFKKKD